MSTTRVLTPAAITHECRHKPGAEELFRHFGLLEAIDGLGKRHWKLLTGRILHGPTITFDRWCEFELLFDSQSTRAKHSHQCDVRADVRARHAKGGGFVVDPPGLGERREKPWLKAFVRIEVRREHEKEHWNVGLQPGHEVLHRRAHSMLGIRVMKDARLVSLYQTLKPASRRRVSSGYTFGASAWA